MKIIGIICEYNPFHNGHLYQIKKVKEKYPDSLIIALVSGPFTQRGGISIVSKWDKASICLVNGIDLVIEFPFVFATQGADIFAKGALLILNMLKIDILVFGYDDYDKGDLIKLARTQLYDENYTLLVKKYLNEGVNYPTALSKALNNIVGFAVNKPNDLLGLAYMREIIENNYNIEPYLIKRTNDYHGKIISGNIISASLIRELFNKGEDVSRFVPKITINYLNKINYDVYFKLLKYQIVSNFDCLEQYQTVDEGIENRIIKYLDLSSSLDDLIMNVKCKRYTYNKLNRMFTHILCGYKKCNNTLLIDCISVLGFNSIGQKYLNTIKKDVPILGNKQSSKLDRRISYIYSLLLDDKSREKYLKMERENKPIIK